MLKPEQDTWPGRGTWPPSRATLVRLVRVAWPVLCLASLTAAAAPPSKAADPALVKSPESRAFAAWAQRVASSQHGFVTKLYVGHLRDDPSLLRAADVQLEGQQYLLVEKAPKERWRLAGNLEEDPAPSPPEQVSWEELPSLLSLQHSLGPHDEEETTIELIDGHWSLLRDSSEENSNDVGESEAHDWEKLTFWRSSWRSNGDENEEPRTEGALILALGPDVASRTALPPTENVVVFGKARWRGPEDASLQVTASREPNEEIRIDLVLRDDVHLPVPAQASDKAFIGADHVELWWKDSSVECPGSKVECPSQVRQLGIGTRADGSVDARWLYPRGVKAPLPRVAATVSGFSVWLPWKPLRLVPLAGAASDEGGFPFTAAFSDADVAGKQKSLVATSTLRRATPASFGELYVPLRGARFPTMPAERLPPE